MTDPDFSLTVVTPPASEPVSLVTLKAHLRLDPSDTSEDALLTSYISASRQEYEAMTGRAVLPSTFDAAFPGWGTLQHSPYWHPWQGWGNARITLPVTPVTNVTGVTYFDTTDTVQTLTGWASDCTGAIGVVYFPSLTLPALSPYRPRPVIVRFIAGQATPREDIVSIVRCRAADLYRYRESSTTDAVRAAAQGWDRGLANWHTFYGGGV